MNDINCTVIINSCDKYSEAWIPFFELMHVYWPDCKYNILLNTEKIIFSYNKNNINVKSINTKDINFSWSLRLKNVLRQVETDFVILLLEDFFFQAPVRQDKLDKCLDWIELNDDIAVFYFKKITGFDQLSTKFNGFIEMIENKKYKFNCQAGLWRRTTLFEVLGNDENPWQFETESSPNKEQCDHKFYCVSWESKYFLSKEDILPYLVERETGFGIWKSKWLWKNNSLFNRHNIKVNYSLGKLSKLYFIYTKWKNSSNFTLPILRKLGLIKIYRFIKFCCKNPWRSCGGVYGQKY
jgi:hypothetical protein